MLINWIAYKIGMEMETEMEAEMEMKHDDNVEDMRSTSLDGELIDDKVVNKTIE